MLQDTSLFVNDRGLKSLDGYYSYSLYLPPKRRTSAVMMRALQDDLYKTFGYTASLEKRLVGIYALKVIDKQKANAIRTKIGPSEFVINGKGASGFKVVNKSMHEVFRSVSWCVPKKAIFLDYTGIDFNVDVSITTDMYSIEKVNEALLPFGLAIMREQKEIEKLVIRD